MAAMLSLAPAFAPAGTIVPLAETALLKEETS
jgi:hypothetical protein